MALSKKEQRVFEELRKKKGVTVVGYGYKETGGKMTTEKAIVVGVKEKLPVENLSPKDIIPQSALGAPTDVQERGEIFALGVENKERQRPASPGCSIGHKCYSADTRILTENGLRFFHELRPDDMLATLNEKTLELEYQCPKEIFEYDHDGELLHFAQNTLDLLITPNHKLFFRNRDKKGDFHLEEAEQVLKENALTSIEFKRDCLWQGQDEDIFKIPLPQRVELFYALKCWSGTLADFARRRGLPYQTVWRWKHGKTEPHLIKQPLDFKMGDWLWFLGWYLSEGSLNKCGAITISEKSGAHHDEILSLLRRMGLNGHVTKDQNVVFVHKPLAVYLKKFGTAKNKYIPKEFKRLPSNRLAILLAALMKGDGHTENGNYRHYKSASKQLANDVFEIGLKCGYGVTLTDYSQDGHEYQGRTISGGTSYRVGFSHVKLSPRQENQIQRVPYKGKIYCVEVPNHIIFVERHGKTCWSGNSITAGTFGALVKVSGEPFILSNCHVLANVNRGKKGDEILQPGPYDAGVIPADVIATLERFVEIEFLGSSNCPVTKTLAAIFNAITRAIDKHSRMETVRTITNLVDCALAKPVNVADVNATIFGIGKPIGWVLPQVGIAVQKSGRTTGYTQGAITLVSAMANVNMGNNEIAVFEDQFEVEGTGEAFSAGGDSGSLVLNTQKQVIGLLFAGSDTKTYCNSIHNVIDKLGLDSF